MIQIKAQRTDGCHNALAINARRLSMVDADNFWFVYLVIGAIAAFMLSLGMVGFADRNVEL